MDAVAIIRDNYATYKDNRTGDRERHASRLAIQAAISALIAFFTKGLSDDNISVLVTAISILIGFAFSALFPIAAEGGSDLPKPRFSEDHDDLRIIKTLTKSFRANVGYFIPLSLTCIFLLLVQMMDISYPPMLSKLGKIIEYEYLSRTNASIILELASKVVLFLTIFLLQEISYTFYRMCFTALSFLRIKDEYKDGRSMSDL